jgi:prepilin-type N-terminal cleavage/methylation domain-containing protein
VSRGGARARAFRGLRAAAGYTLIEVMSALTVLAVGSAGIVGLQKVVALGNSNARSIAAAAALGSAWAERLHADAVTWTDVTSRATTRWLAVDGTITSLSVPSFGAERADLLGADIYQADGNTPAFCTQIVLTTIYPDLIRAEIQVYWDRNGDPITCPVGAPAPPRYGVHTLVTSIRQNVVIR